MAISAYRHHNNLNVAIVAPAVAREGITKQLANQIIELQQERVKVSLILLASSDLSVLVEFGVNIKEVSVLQLRQKDAYLSQRVLWHVLGIIKPISSFLKCEQINCVIAHAPYAHFVMRLIKMVAIDSRINFKLIQYYHGLQYSEYPVDTWKRKVIHKLNRWMAKKYDSSHISVSEAVKREVSQNFIRHSHHVVLYNNLLTKDERHEPEQQPDWSQVQKLLSKDVGKYIILLPNRIDSNKGQLFFMKVLHDFLKSGQVSPTNLAVYIIGSGPDRSIVHKAIDESGLGEIINLTGPLPNSAILKLMEHVQLVVVPSFNEGFSFAALEALQAGTLVLASNAGGLKEVIKDEKTGFLFKAGDSADCLKKLSFIYANRDKSLVNPEVVKKDLTERFSQQAYMNQLLQVIHAS